MKFTEEMIEKAYAEFNSGRDIISGDSPEIITYDFLRQNMKVTDFLQHRRVYLPHLCVCVSLLFPATDQNERWEQVKKYCEDNEISFNKYKSIDFLIRLKENKFRGCNLEDENYTLFIRKNDLTKINVQEIEKTIRSLARKLMIANHRKKKFGIIEYYSYYDIPIGVLKTYLCYVSEYKNEYAIVSNFIERLDITGQLEDIDVKDALVPKTNRHVVNEIYANDETFKRVVSQLLIAEFPITTGTINYAYGLNSKGKLGTLYKKKVKEKFETRVIK